MTDDAVTDDAVTNDATDGAAGPAEGLAGSPVLRVVRGDLDAEELAALVAVVAARNAAAAAAVVPPRRPRSEWGHPARAHRSAHRPGPDQWRRSAWG
ncbi:hypothetical protein HMPREF0063_11438 [Aeromicrobium marinum DSM 15272]|uniref:Acyl-CoA carboxylase epsilon subunit n=1 Tax=Aeromicrobium marinum DSM 15272 TaxID=585531 RepID=E2SBM9_9ACTN|nr:acyl-CoA carboxylase subunit epsilon [Aeromicrobium marinum]EFQ83775.1 hypothetical protein HMPREF0063_11438 [Aeromicrobium marinum DSM 15272]